MQPESTTQPSPLDRIPIRYRGIVDPDVLEEIWVPAVQADLDAEKLQQQERRESLQAFRKRYALNEQAKENQIAEAFGRLDGAIQTRFSEFQANAGEFIRQAIQSGDEFVTRYATGLSPEESYVLRTLQNEWGTAQEENKEFHIRFDTTRTHLERTLINLQQRLALAYARKESVAVSAPQTEKTDASQSQTPELKQEQKSSLDVKSISSIEAFAQNTGLETKGDYTQSLERAIEVLSRHQGIATLEREDVPTIVISDIHARRDFLVNVLKHNIDGESVHEKLKRGEINIVCVGDGMHSENGKSWDAKFLKYDIEGFLNETTDRNVFDSVVEYKQALETVSQKPLKQMTFVEIKQAGNQPSVEAVFQNILPILQAEFMRREMVKSLGVMKMVMDLKSAYPDSFHYTRGNHDDMAEKIKQYHKFANESQQVKEWVTTTYGNDFLQKYTKFEEALPVMVRSKTGQIVVTHTVPNKALTQAEVEERLQGTNISLTWTDNTKGGSSQEAVDGTLANVNAGNARWFIGHRDVPDEMGLAREQFGKVVQINNKDKQVIAIQRPGGSFDKDRDVVDVAA